MVVKNRKGFTLIDLLFLICILGAISSLVIAVVDGSRDDSPKIELFQQPSTQFMTRYTIETTGTSPFKILAKGMVGNQEVMVFEYDHSQYLVTYSGDIVHHTH